jgi:hypothetical protein
MAEMMPVVLALIVLAMPLTIAVLAALSAWTERRPGSAKAYRLDALAGDGVADVDDDSTLFQ